MSTKTSPAKQGKPAARTKPSKTTKASTEPRRPREGSAMSAVITVLDGKREPMTAKEIYAEIRDRKLAPGLKGKTPDQTVAAQLAVHAKRGLYVERAARGKFRLKRPGR